MSLRYYIRENWKNKYYDTFAQAKTAMFDYFKIHTNVTVGFINVYDPDIPNSLKSFGFENPYHEERGVKNDSKKRHNIK